MTIKVPFFRTPFNYDMSAESDASGLRCEDASLAQQSFKDECDINVIVQRFGLTGEMPANVSPPVYSDFTDMVTDYHSALNLVLDAEEQFMRLPAHVRADFQNDAGLFVDAANNAENHELFKKHGLLKTVYSPPASDVGVSSGGAKDGEGSSGG